MTAFTPTQTLHTYFKPTILSARWVESGNRLEFHIEANWFLRHMNRILVGTMIEVASGDRSLESFEKLLAGASRLDAGPTARPHGLRLVGVGYGKEVFSS
jgi:tRNA pseudouridine38-40 synthase